jgi:hypothetical protein
VECFKKHRMDGGHKAACAKSSSKQGGLLLHRYHFSPKGRNPNEANGFNNEGTLNGTAKTRDVSEENGEMNGEEHRNKCAHGTQEVHTTAILLGREDDGDGGGAGRRLTV